MCGCPPDSKIKYSCVLYVSMYYTVCYFTGIFYAVVRKISMLFIDNKDFVLCILYCCRVLRCWRGLQLLLTQYRRGCGTIYSSVSVFEVSGRKPGSCVVNSAYFLYYIWQRKESGGEAINDVSHFLETSGADGWLCIKRHTVPVTPQCSLAALEDLQCLTQHSFQRC